MTDNDAAKALEWVERAVKLTGKGHFGEADYVRTALTKSAKVDGLLGALSDIGFIAANHGPYSQICSMINEAIQRFNGEG